MSRALKKTCGHAVTSPWGGLPVARCAEPEGETTEVIPAGLLLRLIEQAALDASDRVPAFEVIELEPEDVVDDDSAFELAFDALAYG